MASERVGPGARRGRGREAVVLAGALASSAALVAAAFLAPGDPALSGATVLARAAGEASEAVVEEWQRLLRDPRWWPSVWGLRVAREPGPPRVEPRELAALREPGHEAFDALFGEAARLEVREHDLAGALEVLQEALAKDPDLARRAAGRLRVIQLAERRGSGRERDDEWNALARETWHALAAELDGSEAEHGVSVLLLGALAAEGALDERERAAAADRIAGLWADGRLALPEVEDAPEGLAGLPERLRAPERTSLRMRLGRLLPRGVRLGPGVGRAEAQQGARVLAEAGIALDVYGAASVHAGPGWELVVLPIARKDVHVVLMPPGSLRRALEEAVERNGLLPAGFALDFGEGDPPPGELVRARTVLASLGPSGQSLGFALRHADPDALVAAEERRVALVRGGLLVLAVLTAAAGVSTFRALGRERRLAELRSDFVAGVSHELRTPLASILLMAENLEQGRVPDEAARARYHASIRREAQRLRRLVDDVLDFARLERGGPPRLTLEPVDPEALARDLAERVRARAADAGGTLAATVADLPQRLDADEEALRRAVLNLADNALCHSGSRELELVVRGDGAGGLVIALRDRGRGIPRARRAEVFRPFARLASANGSAPGAGLGLAIVREIAEAHGGSVELCDPDEGPGAVFEIRVPAPGRTSLASGEGAT